MWHVHDNLNTDSPGPLHLFLSTSNLHILTAALLGPQLSKNLTEFQCQEMVWELYVYTKHQIWGPRQNPHEDVF